MKKHLKKTLLFLICCSSFGILQAQNAPVIISTPIADATEDSAYNYSFRAVDSDNDEVSLSVKNGTALPSWLNFGSGSLTTTDFGDPIDRPGGVAIDDQGNVYVAEQNGSSIYKITPNGTTTVFATVTPNRKFGMLVDGTDLYISYFDLNKITKLDLNNPGAGEVDFVAVINGPLSIVKKDGYMYVAQYNESKISKIDMANTNVSDFVTGLDGPFGLGFDSNGVLYIANFDGRNLSKFENGVLTKDIMSFPYPASDVKLDADDNIYISSYTSGVKKIAADLSTTTDISTTGIVWGMSISANGTLIWGIESLNKVVKLETGAVLSGTPTNDDVGDHNVCLSATDGITTVDQCFTITVTNVNDAPTITGTPAHVINVGEVYGFTPTGNDVDALDELTYSIVNKPSWASFDTATGKLYGTPEFVDLGDYSGIVISVSDIESASVSLSGFSITVEDNIAPTAPVVTSNALQNTLEPIFTGTAEANSRVVLSFSDGTNNLQYTVLVDAEGIWKVDTANADDNAIIPTIVEGELEIRLTATDASDNTSTQTIQTLQIDTTAPVLPIVLSPANDVLVSTTTYDINGTHNEDSITILLYADDDNDGVADTNTFLTSTTVGENTSLTWSLQVTLSLTEPNNFVIIAEDDFGNRSLAVNVPTITIDTDNDGVPDNVDACANTPTGEAVDTNGCSDSQKDADNDGVNDAEDDCPNTPTGETVDTNGCSDSQKDSDFDGVNDADDQCPDSPEDEAVDAEGCAASQKGVDTDGDGIPDEEDTDDDNDGIADTEDAFPLDEEEDTDTDGDGTGDNADTDDDDDGYTDQDELEEGTDPLEADSYPTDDEATVEEKTLVPAQAFTPNGDGNNDTWVVPGIENYPGNIVKVYNRWGHVVFETKGYSNNWGGFYNSNKEQLPVGSYMYVIDLGNGSAPLQGWIFINN
ncbi:T9SS type B sorting domain-containing protein [Maribacter ulvicola]|uniref:Gliding motility-associated C-terminal domain-containing protein n=1 Tax=Maribacter ulvicola TaxID=228959 RepID=A0A1N6YI71_9FLAO|nr:gliding motility-associated C-terminal domain-containing protein [Maribacter ulvicola]SIR14322.1 gliding motility-associated C-terminal domain-containing protein [Maribacter ulvicola]